MPSNRMQSGCPLLEAKKIVHTNMMSTQVNFILLKKRVHDLIILDLWIQCLCLCLQVETKKTVFFLLDLTKLFVVSFGIKMILFLVSARKKKSIDSKKIDSKFWMFRVFNSLIRNKKTNQFIIWIFMPWSKLFSSFFWFTSLSMRLIGVKRKLKHEHKNSDSHRRRRHRTLHSTHTYAILMKCSSWQSLGFHFAGYCFSSSLVWIVNKTTSFPNDFSAVDFIYAFKCTGANRTKWFLIKWLTREPLQGY